MGLLDPPIRARRIADSTPSGRAVVTGDPAAARAALGVVARSDLILNILDCGVVTGTAATQTAAIKAALDANPGKAFYFPPGDYRLDTQLNVTASNSIVLAAGARIYAGAAMSILINYDNGQASPSNWAQDKCIIGQGTLDGALLAGKVLSIARVIRMTVEGFTIIDGINRGLYTGALGAEVAFRNVRIHNTGTTNVTDNIAVEANMGDCSFQDFIIRDFTVGIRDNSGNVWSNVHPWIGATAQCTARYENSIGFDLNGGSCVLIAPYADTFRTQFKVRASAQARIELARAFTNWGNLTDTLAASYPGTVLDLDTTSVVVFTGAQIQGHPTTFNTFVTGTPTHLTAHTNYSTNWVIGLSNYRDGVVADPVFTRDAVPTVFDAFTAADGAALDSAKWTVTTGGAPAAAAVINGNRARLTTGATGGYNSNDRVNVVNSTSLADAEILVRHTFGTPTVESYMYYGLRISGSTARSADSYCLVLTQPANGFTITKFVAGVGTDLLGATLASLGLAASSVNPIKWVRFRVKGTAISVKIWDDGTTEPAVWSQVATDSSVAAAGKAGAQLSGGSAAVSGVNYVDRWNIYAVDDDKSLVESIAIGLDGKQPIDTDLSAVAALTPSNDDFLQRKSGAWVNRTVAQVKTDLGVSSPNVQVFTAGGTWTKPAGAVSVHVRCQGPGSGGGAGARGPSGTALAGGGAGAGGGLGEITFAASDLTSTVSVGVGTGGAGAAGQTTDGTAGANGSGGSSGTNFGAYVVANRASVGGTGGGLAAGGGAGTAGGGMFSGGSAGAGSTSGAAGAAGGGAGGGGGGGAGGGITTGAAASAGGAGGVSTVLNAGAGTAGSGAAGGAGTSSSTKGPGSGGGGGGANAAGAGYAGGNGGTYGAGGGGGGASLNGSTSGAGGNGGDGICIVTAYF